MCLTPAITSFAIASCLHAPKAVNDIDADKVIAELRKTPRPHTLFRLATVRPDGRVVYNLNVYRVKAPDQIQHQGDYYAKIATVPPDQAFPLRDCSPGKTTTQVER